ncbi:MAG: restriction endonuclease subunit S [Ruminococcus sp.]|nr:restriction endonuclease subunit S [Ruminococcus sp.]
MSQLDKLINELCPDGVEYVKLSDISSYSKIRISIDKLSKNNYISVENLLPDKAGKINATSVPRECNCIYYPVDTILIGNIRPYLRKIWISDCEGGTNGDVLPIMIKDKNKMIPKFLFYILSSENFFYYDIKHSKGAKMPRGDKTAIMNFFVPVPPLEVQRETIRILDEYSEKVTALKHELEKELDLRKKQYSYYRDMLLTFGDDVEWKTLGEIAEVTDYVANGSFASLKENVTYKHNPDYAVLIRTVDFSTKFDSEKMIYIDEKAYNFLEKSRLFGGEIIINNIGAGVGNSFICPNLEIKMCLAPNAVMLKTDNNKFYFYWLNSKYGKIALSKIISKSAMPKFNKTGLRSILIPVPPIEEQERIVKILDRFDTLCNDLTSGIPAEISARQKQYEYYRDKLLTFKILLN